MNVSVAERQAEVQRNYDAFTLAVDQLMQTHPGRFALMRGGEIVEFYQSWEDAFRTGNRFYPDGLFSIQEVSKSPVDLGYFSHAVHLG
jgi:hypothetical protein